MTTHRRDHRLADLYRRNMPEAVGFAYLLTGDRAAAEDLAQEAFMRVAGRLHHLRSIDAFHAYLRRAIVNRHISGLRRRRLEVAWMERSRAEAVPSDSIPDLGAREQLRVALSALPARQRAAVVLHYYADLSEAQVAEEMGCTKGAARALVSRGMESLRREVKGEWDAEDRG